MNEVDNHVRWMLLAYPTLFRNRFEALAHVFTRSGGGYEWTVDGRLACPGPDREDASPESMVARYERRLAEARDKAANNEADCLAGLHRRWVVEFERELVEARHVAENVDVYASDYTAVSHRDAWAWLHQQGRDGVSPYSPINNPPAVVAEEWRAAIRGFLEQIVPPMNGLMGIHKDCGWIAQPRYAAVFNWVMATHKRYETQADRDRAARMHALAEKIVAEIREDRG